MEKGNPPCNAEDNLRTVLLVIEARFRGCVLGRPAYYQRAGLMGCEDMKAEDCTRVRIGLSLVWKAS